jgi:hypothetical protein
VKFYPKKVFGRNGVFLESIPGDAELEVAAAEQSGKEGGLLRRRRILGSLLSLQTFLSRKQCTLIRGG